MFIENDQETGTSNCHFYIRKQEFDSYNKNILHNIGKYLLKNYNRMFVTYLRASNDGSYGKIPEIELLTDATLVPVRMVLTDTCRCRII